jgi:hypothetical protein
MRRSVLLFLKSLHYQRTGCFGLLAAEARFVISLAQLISTHWHASCIIYLQKHIKKRPFLLKRRVRPNFENARMMRAIFLYGEYGVRRLDAALFIDYGLSHRRWNQFLQR